MSTQQPKLRNKFRVFSSIESENSDSKELLIDENDIISQLFPIAVDDKFLGLYSHLEMQDILEEFKIVSALREKGFDNIRLRMKTDDPFEHCLGIYHDKIEKESLLVELVLRHTCIPSEKMPAELKRMPKLDMLFVEWLLSQNPKQRFHSEKPRLPGQRCPGLGLARQLLDVLILLAHKLHVDGITAVPGHYHNALIFSKYFKYLNPESEGKLAALRRDLAKYHLSVISWAVELNCIKNVKTGDAFKWFLDWQVFAIGQAFDDHFGSQIYKKSKSKSFQDNEYTLDEKRFQLEKNRISKMEEVII